MILRLAYLLHRSRTPGLRPPVQLVLTRGALELSFSRSRWLEQHPLTRADLEREAALLEILPLRLRLS